MPNHECIHEKQIMGQSRALERLDAELKYKKERLDDLKEDNKRIEAKIDNLGKDINKFISQSDAKDSKLELRLTKIETRMDEQDKKINENKQDSRDKIQKLAAAVGIIALIITVMNFILPLMR